MPRQSVLWLGLALLLGCGERDRLTFEDGGSTDDTAPLALIDQPAAADTVVFEGNTFIVGGRVIDAGGVDTVYVDLEGADHVLLPLAGSGRDTVRFGIPINTLGFAGTTVTVQVFGVDLVGNRGDRVIRFIHIQ